MKKTYICPELQVTRVNTELMIAASITRINGADGLSNGGSTEESGITTAGVKQNNYDVWDDDWSN